MKLEFARAICCSALLVSHWASGSFVCAQESLRIGRPSTSAEALEPAKPLRASVIATEGNLWASAFEPTKPLRAAAILNLGKTPVDPFQNAINAWEAKNRPSGCGPLAAKIWYNGLAQSYVPSGTYLHGRGPSGPKVKVITLIALSAHDPALPYSEGWWRTMRDEVSDPVLGPQWNLWYTTVDKNFSMRANQLYDTSGAAALQVIINPDGTILEMSPYTGYNREYGNLLVSEQVLFKLQDLVSKVGNFPPLPRGTKLRYLALIVDGSAWILSP